MADFLGSGQRLSINSSIPSVLLVVEGSKLGYGGWDVECDSYDDVHKNKITAVD